MDTKTQKTPKLISYQEYFSYRKKPFLYVKDLKYTLKSFGIDTKKKLKNELVHELDKLYKSIKHYEKHIDSVEMIQRAFKRYSLLKKNKYKGIAFYNRSICQNDDDFYTFENKNEVNDDYFFSYKDSDNFIWWFDIRSYKLLYDNAKPPKKILNPYNRQEIPETVNQRFLKQCKYLLNNKINLSFEKNDQMNEQQIFDFRVLEIFQKMDMLNAAAGGTNVNWFKNLSLHQLKDYYKNLEDIWNYRAELSPQKQKEIVPNQDIFKIPVKNIFQYNEEDKRKLQHIILNEIDTLISSANCDTNKNLGCYYVLIAFAEISAECAQSLPWLVNTY